VLAAISAHFSTMTAVAEQVGQWQNGWATIMSVSEV
jgi:hypothetical protein